MIWSGSADEKHTAAGALCNLVMTATADTLDAFAEARAIPAFVELLQVGIDLAKKAATKALRNLALRREENRSATIEAGAIPPLVELLLSQSTDSDLKKMAISALCTLKIDCHDPHGSVVDHVSKAASLFSAAANKERRAAKARIRELESENDDLKRKLPAEIRG